MTTSARTFICRADEISDSWERLTAADLTHVPTGTSVWATSWSTIATLTTVEEYEVPGCGTWIRLRTATNEWSVRPHIPVRAHPPTETKASS